MEPAVMDKLIQQKTLLAIIGPTASGKTRLALALSQQWPIEIISMDSALIYRTMDIGTAKPSLEEQALVRHHLIDILDPSERYSAADFIEDAKRLVDEIHQRGKLPVLVGGTMMYLHALEQGLAKLPVADPKTRDRLERDYKTDALALHQRLAQVDSLAAQRIHHNDPQRLIRALEVFELTAKPLSQWQAEQAASDWSVNVLKVILMPEDRAQLHHHIEQRLQQMFAQGFLDEVGALYRRGDLNADMPAIRCVGYRQVWQYLQGDWDWEMAQQKALSATRQLAKRQITWLRKQTDGLGLDPYRLSLSEQVTKVAEYLYKFS